MLVRKTRKTKGDGSMSEKSDRIIAEIQSDIVATKWGWLKYLFTGLLFVIPAWFIYTAWVSPYSLAWIITNVAIGFLLIVLLFVMFLCFVYASYHFDGTTQKYHYIIYTIITAIIIYFLWTISRSF